MTEPFTTTGGHLAYKKYIPNRISLGVPLTSKGEGDWVSLAFVSILAPADVVRLDDRRGAK